jgi:hypothetical protein
MTGPSQRLIEYRSVAAIMIGDWVRWGATATGAAAWWVVEATELHGLGVGGKALTLKRGGITEVVRLEPIWTRVLCVPGGGWGSDEGGQTHAWAVEGMRHVLNAQVLDVEAGQ